MRDMWTALSDRDYYGEEPEPEPERCMGCGALDGQACEEWCSEWRGAVSTAEEVDAAMAAQEDENA